MITNYSKEFYSEILTIKEITSRLKFKKNETALNWLVQKNVAVHRHGKRNKFVYAIDFESTMLIHLADNLRKNYPNYWKERLKRVVINDAVYEMILIKLDSNPTIKQSTTKVSPKNNKEKDLLKALLS